MNLTFGGYWAWDPVKMPSLYPAYLISVHALPYMLPAIRLKHLSVIF